MLYDYKKYSYRKYNNSNYIKKNKHIVNSSNSSSNANSAEMLFSKIYTVFTNTNCYYKYRCCVNKIHPNLYNVILPLINKVNIRMKRDVFIKEGVKLYNEMSYYNKHLLLNNLNIEIN